MVKKLTSVSGEDYQANTESFETNEIILNLDKFQAKKQVVKKNRTMKDSC